MMWANMSNAAKWLAVGAAIVAAVIVTGQTYPLWFFLIPPYEAHKNIRKEEQFEAARMRTISALVSALKQVADLAGFEIVGRVVLMDKDSGRIFR